MEQLRFRRQRGGRVAGDHDRPDGEAHHTPPRSLGCSEARNCSFPRKAHAGTCLCDESEGSAYDPSVAAAWRSGGSRRRSQELIPLQHHETNLKSSRRLRVNNADLEVLRKYAKVPGENQA